MKILKLVQGSPEWHAHRNRPNSRNASEAAAVMGFSPYKTRNDLLKEKATGLVPEVDAGTQSRFDDGHAAEAAARPNVEIIIDEELYPATATSDDEYLGASFDGITIDESFFWENKLYNQSLEAYIKANNDLPDSHWPQVEQQFMISKAESCLFTLCDTAGNIKTYLAYESRPERQAAVLAGWKQFDADLAAYQHREEAPKVVSGPVLDLPAVSVQVSGEIAIIDNLTAFGTALTDFVNKQLIREPKTDQDFADLDTQIKTLKKAEDALNQAEAAALAQVATIDQMKRTKDMLHKMAHENRLMAEKLLEAKKASIRIEIKQEGELALTAHIATLNKRLGGKVTLPAIAGNFAGVMSGKKTVKSLRDAVDAELANCKIKANELADRMDINLQSLRELAAGKEFLFMDAQAIVQKENGDLVNLIKARIAEHDAKEQARLDEQREQIRKEEEAKAAAKVRLEQIAQQAKDDAKNAIEKAQQEAPIRHVPLTTSTEQPVVEVSAPRVIKVQIDGKPATKEQVELAVGIIRPSNAELVNVIAAHYNVKKIIAARWLLDAHNSITEAEVA